MLQKIDLRSILFLDIETVPSYPTFEDLSPETQALWEEKSRYNRERSGQGPEESYQSAGIYAEFGKVICIGLGYFDVKEEGSEFRLSSFCGSDEKVLLENFARLLRSRAGKRFQRLCAHNGKEFDFPYLCRRMLINGIDLPDQLDIAGRKPWEVQHLDTMELWKFGDHKHYTSLKLLASVFGIPTPKDDISGSDVRRVYYEERDLERIDRYCRKDVVTLARIYCAYSRHVIGHVIETSLEMEKGAL